MLQPSNLRFIDASEVVDHFVPESDDQYGFWEYIDHWSHGDTPFTLVGSLEFFASLAEFLDRDGDASFEEEYWKVVPIEAWVNLEG